MTTPDPHDDYATWLAAYDSPGEAGLTALRTDCAHLPTTPLQFTLVITPTRPPPSLGGALGGEGGRSDQPAETEPPLQATLASLAAQPYTLWEAFIPETPGAPLPATPGIHTIPAASATEFYAAALARAQGRFILFLHPGDRIHPAALLLLDRAARDPGVQIIYGDEDRLAPSGARIKPLFRTGWDPDLMLGRNAIGLSAAIAVDALRAIGGLPGTDFAAGMHATLLTLGRTLPHATLPGGPIRHVPAILWHRAAAPELPNATATRALVQAHLQTGPQSEGATVGPAPTVSLWNRIHWPLPEPPPLASIIVPTRNGGAKLRRCLESLLNRTEYPAFEVIVVDNGSDQSETRGILATVSRDPRVRILPWPHPFNFAALNNDAAAGARGSVLVFLNDDTEAITTNWLDEMMAQALRPGIGAVGAKLLYADGRVQHAGMVFGPGGNFAHQYRLADQAAAGPNGELALVRTVLAVTGACMAVPAAAFHAAGGFDTEFQTAYNDVDLCLRLGDFGYRVVCTPFALLYHLESATRGADDTPGKLAIRRREDARFVRLWRSVLDRDPFHNANLLFEWGREGFATPPRHPLPWQGSLDAGEGFIPRPDPDLRLENALRRARAARSDVDRLYRQATEWEKTATDAERHGAEALAGLHHEMSSMHAKMAAEIAALKDQVQTLDARLQTSGAQLAESHAAYARLQADLAGVESERDHLAAERTRLDAALARAEGEAVRWQADFDAVIQSRSWRITRPVRGIARRIRHWFRPS